MCTAESNRQPKRFQSMCIVFVPVTVHFCEGESEYSENYSVSMLWLLPHSGVFNTSWWVDIFVLDEGGMVLTSMCSGLLSVASFVLGKLFGCVCVCHHTKWHCLVMYSLLAPLSQVSWQTRH